MKTFARIVDSLKAAVAARSEKELAAMLGINYRTFATEKRRNSIPYRAIIDFCVRRGINLDAVFYDKNEKAKEKFGGHNLTHPTPLAKMLPIFERIPPMFPEKVGEESVQRYMPLPDATEDSFGLVIRDESMSPALKPDDYVVFHPARSFSNRDLVIVNDRWGETHVRRYREGDGQKYLTPDNPEYPELTPGPDTHLIGIVVAAWRRLKLF